MALDPTQYAAVVEISSGDLRGLHSGSRIVRETASGRYAKVVGRLGGSKYRCKFFDDGEVSVKTEAQLTVESPFDPAARAVLAAKGEQAIEIDEAQSASLRQKHQGSAQTRWNWDGAQFNEIADQRPLVRFTPTLVDVDVGDPQPTVTIDVLSHPNFSGTKYLQLTDTRVVKLSFTNGTTVVNVPTGKARSFRIDSNEEFIVETPFSLRVSDTEF